VEGEGRCESKRWGGRERARVKEEQEERRNKRRGGARVEGEVEIRKSGKDKEGKSKGA
jgi:hypothetical protein